MSFSVDEIRKLIHNLYNLEGDLISLPGEIGQNFQLTTRESARYTFKIASPVESEDVLAFQHAMMDHLISTGFGLEVPEVVVSENGNRIEKGTDHEGKTRLLSMLTWVEGRPLATVNPHTPQLLFEVGTLCGKLSNALTNFDHPAAHRVLKWDLAQAEWIKPYITEEDNAEKRELLSHFYRVFESVVVPVQNNLRKSVIYNDANDYNVLVSQNLTNQTVPGIIDFGDAVYSHTINELAIALAYAMMHKPDPVQAAHQVVRGYNSVASLKEVELEVLFPLITTRLIISVTNSRINRQKAAFNKYLQISDKAAWDLLKKLRKVSPEFALCTFRDACHMEPHPHKKVFAKWAKANHKSLKPIVKFDLKSNQVHWLDLGMGSATLGNQSCVLDDQKLNELIVKSIKTANTDVGLGKYNEVRPFYTSKKFEHEGNEGPEWRTVHLGLDVFLKAGESVFAPAEGTVFSVADNSGDRNYGPTVILKHEVLPELTYFTLYGHLNRSVLTLWKPGDLLKAGEELGSIGDIGENGGWAPHLHFQIILDTPGHAGDFPGVALYSQRNIWTSICPDPWLLITGTTSPDSVSNMDKDLVAFRKLHLGKNLSLSYHQPLRIERGYLQYLYDSTGRKYLDTVNNVAHVGHEHPRVVAAGQTQMAVLNTNTRYLHKNLIDFTESLLSTMPNELDVAYVVNSGSEANELAIRIAKTYTGQKDFVVIESGYHGNSNACVEISSYKFDGRGGKGPEPHVHVVPKPDDYRGIYKQEKDSGKKYAQHIMDQITAVKKNGKNLAGFICESILSCGGQIVLPEGYLKNAYQAVHAVGGVCIADEVQTGCGRAGSHFWAFETQNVIPDIVTIGKPMGNGHPLGVVVTSRALADAFANGMEYFNTFGGNPVSCAIGYEVLNVIREESLQQNALNIGAYLKNQLNLLKAEFPIISDVRGLGLFLGVELVLNENHDPAPSQAAYLVNRMRELGILMSTDGPFENVLKIKPPMVFSKTDCDLLISTLERVLREDFLKIN